jgi:Na+/melibiose symporter-like transporter
MLPILKNTDFIHPSQIVRIHFLITGIVRSICIQNVRCRVQVLATFLRICNRLSFLASNRPSLIMSVMWLLSPILHQASHEKEHGIFIYYFTYTSFLPRKTTWFNSVWSDAEGSVFSKSCTEFKKQCGTVVVWRIFKAFFWDVDVLGGRFLAIDRCFVCSSKQTRHIYESGVKGSRM